MKNKNCRVSRYSRLFENDCFTTKSRRFFAQRPISLLKLRRVYLITWPLFSMPEIIFYPRHSEMTRTTDKYRAFKNVRLTLLLLSAHHIIHSTFRRTSTRMYLCTNTTCRSRCFVHWLTTGYGWSSKCMWFIIFEHA